MTSPFLFPYTSIDDSSTSLMPLLSLDISHQSNTVSITGLLDTGAAINVLPRHIGEALGADWDAIPTVIPLAGNLSRQAAKPLIVTLTHSQLTADRRIRLAFAWAETNNAPVIFGQTNFFAEFDVCFYRQRAVFEIHARG